MKRKTLKRLKELFIETEDYSKTIPKTYRLRNTLIVLAVLGIGFTLLPISWGTTPLTWIVRIVIGLFLIKFAYESYKITKVFEEWERNYRKYKKYFV